MFHLFRWAMLKFAENCYLVQSSMVCTPFKGKPNSETFFLLIKTVPPNK